MKTLTLPELAGSEGSSEGTSKGLETTSLAEKSSSAPKKATSPKPAKLGRLLEHPDLWQAGQLRPVTGVCATGYDELDDALNGGWPSAGVTELLHDAPGIGELQLLLPTMRELSQAQKRWLVWINPPYQPCAPALQAAGVDISRILLVHPRNTEQALWALEQSLKSGGSAMVLCWFGHKAGRATLNEDALTPAYSRRLQLAARQGNSFGCLFRSTAARKQPSMASLRLQLDSAPAAASKNCRGKAGELTVHVRKQRGGWPVQDLTLTLDYTPARQQQQQQAVEQQLMLWRHGKPAGKRAVAARQRRAADLCGQPLPSDTRSPLPESRVLH